MSDNGVYVSNREIYDAVQDLSKKVDVHLAQHAERDSAERSHKDDRRARWGVRAALIAAGLSSVATAIGWVR